MVSYNQHVLTVALDYRKGKKMVKKARSKSQRQNNKPEENENGCPHSVKAVKNAAVCNNFRHAKVGYCKDCDAIPDEDNQGCEDSMSTCICLKCCYQACSRQCPEQHALKHYKEQPAHSICVNISTWVVWCYECDSEVEVTENTALSCIIDFLKRKCTGESQKKTLDINLHDANVKSIAATNVSTNIKGLKNLGNTCFFNSVVQNMARIGILHHFLKKSSEPSKVLLAYDEKTLSVELTEGAGSLATSLATLFNEMNTSTSKVISPARLLSEVSKKAPQFRGYQQHDSHELLRYLLDSIRTEELKRIETSVNELTKKTEDEELDKEKLKATMKKTKTYIDDIFGGVFVSTICCLKCKKKSSVYEDFFDLSIPITTVPVTNTAKKWKKKDTAAAEKPPSKHQMKMKVKAARKGKRQRRHSHNRYEKQHSNDDARSESTNNDEDDNDGDEPTTDDKLIGDTTDVTSCEKTTVITELFEKSEPLETVGEQNGEAIGKTVITQLMTAEVGLVNKDDELLSEENKPLRTNQSSTDATPVNQSVESKPSCSDDTISKDKLCTDTGEITSPDKDISAELRDAMECTVEHPIIYKEQQKNNSDIEQGEEAGYESVDSDVQSCRDVQIDGGEPYCEVNLIKRNSDTDSGLGSTNSVEVKDTDPMVKSLTDDFEHISFQENHFSQPEEAVTDGYSSNEEMETTLAPAYKLKPNDDSLEGILQLFCSVDMLEGENKFFCQHCTSAQNKNKEKEKKVYTEATKQLLLSELPSVLTLHLKRFEQVGGGGRHRKVSKYVRFPPTLNMAPFCSNTSEYKAEDVVYRLSGIVEHSGNLHSGHYVAYVRKLTKDSNTARWYCISDASVSSVNEDQLLNKQAYLLFYERVASS